MELKIKTFMQDSRRPQWLLRLLYHVNTYVKMENLNEVEASQTFSLIISAMKEIRLVRRNATYPIYDCVNVEEYGNHLTISSTFKNRPIVEFSIE